MNFRNVIAPHRERAGCEACRSLHRTTCRPRLTICRLPGLSALSTTAERENASNSWRDRASCEDRPSTDELVNSLGAEEPHR